MRYDELPTEPPAYDGGDSLDLEGDEPLQREMELMEFEDATQSFGQRVSHYRSQWSTKVVMPVRMHVLDPLAEGLVYANRQWEASLARVGNPLIVKRFVYVVFVGLVLYAVLASGFLPDDSSRTAGSFSDRGRLEEFALASIDLKSMEENLEFLGSIDHIAGTAGDLSTARFVEAFLKDRGVAQVDFEEVPVLLNYPGKTTLKYGDTELDISQQFNPLSKQAKATGKLMYAYYGRATDYQNLKNGNIDTSGAVCIVKYGALPVSQKVLLAENFGCAALIFTSETDAFPDSYERRSVGIPEFYPGDPQTPGWSSQTAQTHLSLEDAQMAKIPSATLTWNQVMDIWNKLGDKGISFEDGLYSGDGSSLEATLDNQVVYKEQHPVWNVLGKINGREQPDQALFIGAQRDAPCKGAIYPDTGTVILLEVAQLFEKMRANFNWEPLRSVYFFSWDASEYNFAGATELLELAVHEVRKEGMVYLDLTDAIAGDHIEARGDALLASTVLRYEEEYNLTWGKQYEEYGNHVPFMGQGIPTLEVAYKGGLYPKYTCQDTFENFQKTQMDPDFQKHRTLVELVLKIALHIVEDPLVPLDISGFVEQMNSDFKDLQAYASDVQPGSHYNFAPITSALLELKQLGKDLDMWRKAWTEIVEEDAGMEPSLLSVHRWNWNSRLSALEKFFLLQEGLTGRPWYKNIISGPQLFKPDSGVGSWWSFPGIRDALSQGWDVDKEIQTVAHYIVEGCGYFVKG